MCIRDRLRISEHSPDSPDAYVEVLPDGSRLPFKGVANPVLVLAHYLVSSTPHDAFYLSPKGVLREALVTTRVHPGDSSVMMHSELNSQHVWRPNRPCRVPRYCAELCRALQAAAQNMIDSEQDGWLFFATRATEMLATAANCTDGSFGAIVIDSGVTCDKTHRICSLDCPLNVTNPRFCFRGAVNGIDAWFADAHKTAVVLSPPRRQQSTRIRLLARKLYTDEHVRFGYDEFVRRFSVDDLQALIRPVLSRPGYAPCLRLSCRKPFAAAPLMALMQLACTDPELFVIERQAQW
eukprot:TRINITY_DN19797_c0_g1_i2.p1 TRINITY_DN19797_c0_g1~~TRINITY_DN19797_c0_g1_i2.p1  ORF type:complete len:294 (+),score=38.20 TRINITY_DN19797_c0_g1_i2:85-966(+)